MSLRDAASTTTSYTRRPEWRSKWRRYGKAKPMPGDAICFFARHGQHWRQLFGRILSVEDHEDVRIKWTLGPPSDDILPHRKLWVSIASLGLGDDKGGGA